MAVAISLPNQKGGVGKTTLALHLAWRCQELGLKTLGVDLDPQGNFSESMLGPDVLDRLDLEDQVLDSRIESDGRAGEGDVCRMSYHLFSEELPAPLAPYPTQHEGLDIIPAAINDDALGAMNQLPTEAVTRLAGHLATIRGEYDVIIIDVPPAKGVIHISGLIASDRVVLPLMMSAYPMRGVRGMIQTLKELESVGNKTELVGVLVNIYSSRSKEHREGVRLLGEHLGSLLLGNKVGYRASLDTAVGEMRPVWRVGSGAAREASSQVRGAIEEIILRCGFQSVLDADREEKKKAARARQKSAKSRKAATKPSKSKVKTGADDKEDVQ